VVSFDEKATAHIIAPVRGWVTKVEAKRVGRPVRAGETLATLHSVDVYLAELDLVAQVQQFTTQDLLSNARRRLQRWSMPKASIDRVEKTGLANGTLPLVALRTGTLVKSTAVPGMFVEPTELFTITDPTRVWVFADFTEADAERIRVGTPAKLSIAGVKPITANVAYIYRWSGRHETRFELVTANRSARNHRRNRDRVTGFLPTR
jgi:multidrug resistance efflux pump